MAILMFRRSGRFQEYYTLESDCTTVGRREGCEIVLSDRSVSREHARLERVEQGWELYDLGSRNGTKINGRAIERALLTDGDYIHFGEVAARFMERVEGELPLDASEGGETMLISREELDSASEQLGYLYDLAEAVASIEDENSLVSFALKILGDRLQCENAYIGLYDEGGSRLGRGFFRSFGQDEGKRFALSHSILRRAATSRSGLLLNDARSALDLKDSRSVIDSGVRSVLCAPMMVGGRLVGLVYADSRSRVRPFSRDDLAFATALGSLTGALIHSVRSRSALRRQNQQLHCQIEGLDLVGLSLALAEVRQQIERYATKGDSSVLILGESGTGKELAAHMLHRLSSRSDGPLLVLNCAAIPRELFESELFGHAKGSFTSATQDRRGLFELANRGTLFLDEIAEMPAELQGKLLRVLETGEVRPVGAERTLKVDVRVLAATNKNLQELANSGGFRRDLYYRLNVLSLTMPPLRDHPEDIPALAEHFLEDLRQRVATPAQRLSPEALELLTRHCWPGNVRELRNVLERALYSCDGEEIGPEDIAGLDDEPEPEVDQDEAAPPVEGGPLEREIEQLERARINEALQRLRWNRSRAAAELGLSRKTLLAKMRKYGMQ